MCQNIHVPAGHGQTFTVRKGQLITVFDREGQQAAVFVAVNSNDIYE